MKSSSYKGKVVAGVLWTLLENVTTHFASFLVTLLLARILTPADYGTVALLTLIVNLSVVVIDSGFGNALVQKKNADEMDFNSVFYLSLFLSTSIYIIIFFAATWVGRFYHRPELVWLLRVLALTLVFNAIGSVQGAELRRKLRFDLSFRISIVRFVFTSSAGISMALLGLGPWALVGSSVAGSLSGVIASWSFIGWRPRLMFSFASLLGLWRFGWKFTASWFLSLGYDNLYGMIVGKVYSPADLAFYDRGRQIPQLGLIAVNGAIQKVSFPAIAQIQDDTDRVRSAMRRMVRCSTFMIFPLMTGMAITAKSLVPIFYGSQWECAIPFLVLASASYFLYPFHTINLQTLSAIGRSDMFLTLEIVKTIVSGVVLYFTYQHGVLMMVAGSAFVLGPLAVVINAFPVQRLLRYNIVSQLSDALPSFALCLLMAVLVFPLSLLEVNPYVTLLCQAILGLAVYFLSAWLFKIDALREYAIIFNGVLTNRVPKAVKPAYSTFMRRLEVNV